MEDRGAHWLMELMDTVDKLVLDSTNIIYVQRSERASLSTD